MGHKCVCKCPSNGTRQSADTARTKQLHVFSAMSLLWHHNGRDGVSTHQPHDCLLNLHSGADRKKSSASLTFLLGIPRWPVNSPHKWPVTRNMFPFDDVIMYPWLSLISIHLCWSNDVIQNGVRNFAKSRGPWRVNSQRKLLPLRRSPRVSSLSVVMFSSDVSVCDTPGRAANSAKIRGDFVADSSAKTTSASEKYKCR